MKEIFRKLGLAFAYTLMVGYALFVAYVILFTPVEGSHESNSLSPLGID